MSTPLAWIRVMSGQAAGGPALTRKAARARYDSPRKQGPARDRRRCPRRRRVRAGKGDACCASEAAAQAGQDRDEEQEEQHPRVGKAVTPRTSLAHFDARSPAGPRRHQALRDREGGLHVRPRRPARANLSKSTDSKKLGKRCASPLSVKAPIVAKGLEEFQGGAGYGIEAVLIVNVGAQIIRDLHCPKP